MRPPSTNTDALVTVDGRTLPLRATRLVVRSVAGKHIGQLCERIEQQRHQFGARQILGVLSLTKKRCFSVIDDCCRVALEADVANYRNVARLADRPRAEG
jgi:hypothetical protein